MAYAPSNRYYRQEGSTALLDYRGGVVSDPEEVKAALASRGGRLDDFPVFDLKTPGTVSSGPTSYDVNKRAALFSNAGDDLFGAFSSEDLPNEEQIRQRRVKDAQGVIDLINQNTNRIIDEDRKFYETQKNRTRAMNLSSGLAGSDFAGGNARVVEQEERDVVQSRMRENEAKVAAILGEVNAAAVKEAEDKTKAIFDRSVQRANLRSQFQTEARTKMKDLAAADLDIEKLKTEDPGAYATLLKQTGYDPLSFDAIWNSTLDKSNQVDYQYAWRGDDLVAMGQDPRTGQLVTKTYKADVLGIPKGTALQTVNLGESVYWYDEKDPTNADGTPKLKRLGAIPKKDSEPTRGDVLDEREEAELAAAQYLRDNADAEGLTDDQRIETIASKTGLTTGRASQLVADFNEDQKDKKPFLTKDYLKKTLSKEQLKKAAREYFGDEFKKTVKDAGYYRWFGLDAGDENRYLEEKGVDEFLGNLDTIIEAKREAGMTDKEIQKDLEAAINKIK